MRLALCEFLYFALCSQSWSHHYFSPVKPRFGFFLAACCSLPAVFLLPTAYCALHTAYCPLVCVGLRLSLSLILLLRLLSAMETYFCLSSSPDKQKCYSLRPLRLCGEILKESFSSLNLAPFASLRELSFLCFALCSYREIDNHWIMIRPYIRSNPPVKDDNA